MPFLTQKDKLNHNIFTQTHPIPPSLHPTLPHPLFTTLKTILVLILLELTETNNLLLFFITVN